MLFFIPDMAMRQHEYHFYGVQAGVAGNSFHLGFDDRPWAGTCLAHCLAGLSHRRKSLLILPDSSGKSIGTLCFRESSLRSGRLGDHVLAGIPVFSCQW